MKIKTKNQNTLKTQKVGGFELQSTVIREQKVLRYNN